MEADILKEQWKLIRGTKGKYEVSNMGKIRNREQCITLKESTLNGYKRVTLNLEGRKKYVLVHRIVATAFKWRDKRHGRNEVNHIDGDKANNRVDNLQWVTHENNQYHAALIGHMGHKISKETKEKLRAYKNEWWRRKH